MDALPPNPPTKSIEFMLAAYLEALVADGPAAAEALLATASNADEVRRRVAQLRLLGFLPTEGHAAPERLGSYDLLRVLGRGGMGIVYEAVHRTLRRRAAVKCVLAKLTDDALARARFRREVEALAQLQHEHIVAILDVGEDPQPWYAMELVDGPSLAAIARIRREHPTQDLATSLAAAGISPAGCARHRNRDWTDFCLRMLLSAATALGHAHARGIVHRDVKPANLMLRADGRLVVVDFGLACAATDERLTRTGDFLGSPAYAAPEQFAAKFATPAVDVHALGVVLLELLLGEHPFGDPAAFAAQRQAARREHGQWRHRLRHLPHDVATACLQAIDPDPQRRYPSGTEFAGDLEAVLHGKPIAARRAPWLLTARRWLQRRPGIAAAVVSSAVLAIAIPGLAAAEASRDRQHQEILTDLGRLFGRYNDSRLPSKSGGAPLTPVAAIARARAELERESAAPKARARFLLQLGLDARECSDLVAAEQCLREAVQLFETAAPSSVDHARTLAALAVVATHRQGRATQREFERAAAMLASAPGSLPAERLQFELDYCRALIRSGEPHEGERLLLALLPKVPANDPALVAIRIDALAFLALRQALNERIGESRPWLEQAMALAAATTDPAAMPAVVRARAVEAEWLDLAGQRDRCTAAFDAAVALASEVYRSTDHLEVLAVRRERAFHLRRVGRHVEAEAELRSILPAMEARVGELDPDLFDVVLVLAKVLRDAGRYPEAITCFERRAGLVLARARLWYGGEQNADPTNAGGAWLELADVRARAGDLDGAERDCRFGLAHYERHVVDFSRSILSGNALVVLGDILARRQRLDEAEQVYREGLTRLIHAVGNRPEDYLRAFAGLRGLLETNGRAHSAKAVANAELARLLAWAPALDRACAESPRFSSASRGNYLWMLGTVQAEAGDGAAARASLDAALPHLIAAYGADHWRTVAARAELDKVR